MEVCFVFCTYVGVFGVCNLQVGCLLADIFLSFPQLVLDTGSTLSWVYGIGCAACALREPGKRRCRDRRCYYNSSASLTIDPNFAISERLYGGKDYKTSYLCGEVLKYNKNVM